VLLDHPAARVVHGDDPGDYYCEHMFFESQRAAVTSGAVARNRFGEPLVGFLHIPRDEFVRQEPQAATYAQESRHAGTREVVGAALGGFLLEAKTAVTGPVRIMLNGYDRFMDVVNNPTGDFVSHVENVDAVMQRALGSALLTPTGEPLPPDSGNPDGVVVYRYRIKDTDFPDGREVLVRTQRFPVTDDAIDGQSHVSVQRGISRYRPHVVLSMGVAGGRNYMAEHHADDGGLRRRPGERLTHDGMARPSESLADNFALARALVAGARPGISVASLRTGGQSPV